MTLNDTVLQYVAFRKSMGEEFDSAASLLKTFCRRIGGDIELADITAEHVQAFLVGTGPMSGYWRRKYDVLRGLYRYAISRGLVNYAPLPSTVPRAPRFKPYLYTEDEVRRLLTGCDSCLNPPRKLEPHTLRAILLLLYGAGLRIGEAVALTVADVDVPDSVITIRNTKFHRRDLSRLAPSSTRSSRTMPRAGRLPATRQTAKHPSLFCVEERPLQSRSLSVRSDVSVGTSECIAAMAHGTSHGSMTFAIASQ